MVYAMKIRWVSDTLRYLAICYMIFLPLFSAGFWITGGYPTIDPDTWIYKPFVGIDLVPPLSELQLSTRLVAFLIQLIPIALILLILTCAVSLLKKYRKLSFFTINHVKNFKNIGYLLLIYQLFIPFYDFIMTYTIVAMQSATDRISVVGISSLRVELMVVSIFILLISWIMEKGYQLQEEQKLVV